ncbi:hypothetical protein GE061_018797 [Apolygus lucorum]|uniref:Uncharacterized protein n=1 Tax=Apolygus lucorum TaxID=248454 RepID=A0A8S9X6M1_APOLU|nr:hypothetical protein GE061_018797 [Apolygus lucorum]
MRTAFLFTVVLATLVASVSVKSCSWFDPSSSFTMRTALLFTAVLATLAAWVSATDVHHLGGRNFFRPQAPLHAQRSIWGRHKRC